MIDAFWTQFAEQSLAEIVAVVLAIAYVLLAAKQNIWCWPCALFSTAIYTWIFWDVSLFFQAVLNFYYLIMAVYGWVYWKKMHEKEGEAVVSWPLRQHLATLVGIAIATAITFYVSTSIFAETIVFLDVLVAVASAAVTYLMATKVLENWLYWMIINSLAAYLYFSAGLVLTGVLFVGYVMFSVYGFVKWRSSQRTEIPSDNQTSVANTNN